METMKADTGGDGMLSESQLSILACVVSKAGLVHADDFFELRCTS